MVVVAWNSRKKGIVARWSMSGYVRLRCVAAPTTARLAVVTVILRSDVLVDGGRSENHCKTARVQGALYIHRSGSLMDGRAMNLVRHHWRGTQEISGGLYW